MLKILLNEKSKLQNDMQNNIIYVKKHKTLPNVFDTYTMYVIYKNGLQNAPKSS